MLELSKDVSQCALWKKTLAPQAIDDNIAERERLRSSFMAFRYKASLLATEISRDLPELTVHDITHLDALWEIASEISGNDFKLTPTEGYVLGGSILLHDLAMSVAATPGGMQALRGNALWNDTLNSYFRKHKNRNATPEELATPPEDASRLALFTALRLLHAENAERLAVTQLGVTDPQYLIDDVELRQSYGSLIGQIAHSHWWPLAEVEKRFSRVIGAPHWAPAAWTIDPLKIACILRAADASHIDARRAPNFRREFTTLGPESSLHWDFQKRLNKSYIRDDALIFTSGQPFSVEQASAWWLCLDTLKMIDSELRSIDSLFAERSSSRFAARRVAGVDNPERLASYIHTSEWHPIHASVHLSDLPRLIRSLGGEELYGRDPTIPIRELIQNARDAIRARQHYENRDSSFGEIRVSLIEREGQHLLRISDNGVGMSRTVLTKYLLDFGSSFWTTPQVQEEFPGLLSSEFQSTGRYGIGFFSVFMASDHVKVVTRRPDSALADTLVLEFGNGLTGRPILRPAAKDEQLIDGGTVVELVLRSAPRDPNGILHRKYEETSYTDVLELCRVLSPTLDTRLIVVEGDSQTIAIEPADWVTMPGDKLLVERCDLNSIETQTTPTQDFIRRVSENLRIIKSSSGEPIGRACITTTLFSHGIASLPGHICVGGFSCTALQGICGFLLGDASRAARDRASPIANSDQLAAWATEQADIIPKLYDDPIHLADAAQVVRLCGGKTRSLPIAQLGDKWLAANDILSLGIPDEIVILDRFKVSYELRYADKLKLNNNVFVTNASGVPVIFEENDRAGSYRHGDAMKNGTPSALYGALIEAAAEYWQTPLPDLISCNSFDRQENVLIGECSTGDVHAHAIVLRRPK